MLRFRCIAAAMLACIIASAAASRCAADEPSPPPTCTGRDLLDEEQRSDPAAYRTILDAMAKVPNAEGLLWKIEKGSVPPSYLFGTMHATDEGAVAIARSMAPYVKQTRTVATELGSAMGPGMKSVAAVKLALRAMTSKITTESLLESADDRRRLEQTLAPLHMSLAVALRMPPWFVATLLALPPCEIERQQRDLPIVDHVIEDIGKGFGEPLVALETIDEQLDALESLDPKYAVRMIVLTVRNASFVADSFATMTALYRQQRIGAMVPVVEVAAKLSQEDVEADTAFMRTIVERRNRVMRQRAEPLIEAGATFIAVGALHLVGAHGLVELLRQDGYTVTRVP
jgi:uncharacterized protein YbaP (TraB family)